MTRIKILAAPSRLANPLSRVDGAAKRRLPAAWKCLSIQIPSQLTHCWFSVVRRSKQDLLVTPTLPFEIFGPSLCSGFSPGTKPEMRAGLFVRNSSYSDKATSLFWCDKECPGLNEFSDTKKYYKRTTLLRGSEWKLARSLFCTSGKNG